jgi:flagellin-like protein
LKALRREGRRGVSPVIATLLLIVIAVAASVLVYMWVVGYATQMRPAAPETTERLMIEAGKLFREAAASDNVNATLYVRNVGGSPVYIATAYLLTPAYDAIDVALATVPGGDSEIYVNHVGANITSLDPGKAYNVTIRFTGAWPATGVAAGRTYVVRIVTSLGSEFATELKLLAQP